MSCQNRFSNTLFLIKALCLHDANLRLRYILQHKNMIDLNDLICLEPIESHIQQQGSLERVKPHWRYFN